MTVEQVSFTSAGETVRGDLYLPQGPGPHPVVVMAGGWCYVKELRQPQYAEEFASRGLAALVFDYRRLGVSDGEPRQHIIAWDQIEDYRNAISYLESRDDIDGGRVGAWGISYSGGHVLILGAIDSRVKVVVSNVPVIDGWDNMNRVHGSERMRRLQQLVLDDRRKRFATGEHSYVGMSAPRAGSMTSSRSGPSTRSGRCSSSCRRRRRRPTSTATRSRRWRACWTTAPPPTPGASSISR